MSNDKSRRILEKIVTHIDHTLEYCQGQTFESFMNNRMLQEACIFNLLQIGDDIIPPYSMETDVWHEKSIGA